MGKIQIEYRSIESILPYEKNPRINDDAVPAVMESMQQAWQRGFEDLIEAMRTLAVLYDTVPDGETELNCSWGDGVLEDTDAEYQRRWAMVLAGKLRTEDFLQWYFGCSKKEAFAMIPGQPEALPEEE